MSVALTVAALSNHPLNSNMLHGHLSRFRMPNRDRFWLPFLHQSYGNNSSVDRLITWALELSENTDYKVESVHLAGIALSWFLASSNRYLRDNATKGLVVLFKSRINLLIELLKKFETVDDFYIKERLYAVAYGCSLISASDERKNLSLYVYATVFKDNKVPVHILLRDYARGIVEVGLSYYPEIANEIDKNNIKPPYGSSWPRNIPSLSYLKRKYDSKKIKIGDKEVRAYGDIWSSLMYSNEGGISDFGNYIVDSAVKRWKNVKLKKDGTPPKSSKQKTDEFLGGLAEDQSKIWKELEAKKQSHSLSSIFVSMKLYSLNGDKIDPKTKERDALTTEKLKKEVAEIEKRFIDSLPQKKRKLYLNVVKPYKENYRNYDDLDCAAIQRLIFSKIISLGWTPELFYDFDSKINERMRDANKPERIGKKYQWIAFHEVLARISDNFAFSPNWDDGYHLYEGPWQIYRRDIDPSHVLSKTKIDERVKCWWINVGYNSWKVRLSNKNWVKQVTDIDFQKKLITTKDRKGKKWLNLEGSARWTEPKKPGEKDYWTKKKRYLVFLEGLPG